MNPWMESSTSGNITLSLFYILFCLNIHPDLLFDAYTSVTHFRRGMSTKRPNQNMKLNGERPILDLWQLTPGEGEPRCCHGDVTDNHQRR